MEDIGNKIRKFNEIKNEISEYFGCELYDGFDDMTKEAEHWYVFEGGVSWIHNGEEYSEDARLESERDDFTLVYINSSTGESFHAIFDNKNKVTEEEFEDLV